MWKAQDVPVCNHCSSRPEHPSYDPLVLLLLCGVAAAVFFLRAPFVGRHRERRAQRGPYPYAIYDTHTHNNVPIQRDLSYRAQGVGAAVVVCG